MAKNWRGIWTVSGRTLCSAAALLSFAGCMADVGDPSEVSFEQGVGEKSEPLYYDSSKLWSDPSISVCWAANYPTTERSWVRNAIELTYEPFLPIDFTGWGVCGAGGAEIVIQVGNDLEPNSAIGARAASPTPSMDLNFFSGAAVLPDWSICYSDSPGANSPYTSVTGTEWPSFRRYCVVISAIHEFGHALAALDEDSREDEPSWCGPGDLEFQFTPYKSWDVTSVMNGCNHVPNADGYLSTFDVGGLTSLYGADTNDYAWYGIGDVRYIANSQTSQTMYDIRASRVVGTYQPIVGDFDGDSFDDILWYGPGNANDSIWFGAANRTFDKSVSVSPISGTYKAVAGDFDGDGRDDVWWHLEGLGVDRVWWGNSARGFNSTSVGHDVGPGGSYIPIAGNFDGDAFDDVFFYAPGSPSERLFWGGNSRTGFNYASPNPVIATAYKPLAGDFDKDGRSDILWFNPAVNASSPMWWAGAGRNSWTVTSIDTTPSNDQYAAVADVDDDGRDDIVWADSRSSQITLFSTPRGSYSWTRADTPAGARPLGGDFDGDGIGDVFWYKPG
jgi:hypothetical protein